MKKTDRIPGLRVSLVRDASAELPRLVDTPFAVYEVVRAFIPMGDEREYFIAVYLDSRRRVKGVTIVSIGTMAASLIHPREVFRPAIVAGAAAVIVAHNHPSGDTTPSAEDKEGTRRLVQAGKLLGIPILDHIIIADRPEALPFSFKEASLL